jgi:NAD(P)-dependent dehydrogenase (short-subunit alcohol dehydrogenase family)
MWSEIAGDIAKIEEMDTVELQDKWIERIPLGRLASPVDIANTVLFLCSEKASYITGQVINVCGGLSIV